MIQCYPKQKKRHKGAWGNNIHVPYGVDFHTVKDGLTFLVKSFIIPIISLQ